MRASVAYATYVAMDVCGVAWFGEKKFSNFSGNGDFSSFRAQKSNSAEFLTFFWGVFQRISRFFNRKMILFLKAFVKLVKK